MGVVEDGLGVLSVGGVKSVRKKVLRLHRKGARYTKDFITPVSASTREDV